MDDSSIITIEPGKRSGKPCIRGLRITVYDVLEYLASGMSAEEILAYFPKLPANLGVLSVGEDQEGKLETSTPFKSFEVFVTAEKDAQVTASRGERVLWATAQE